MTRTTIKLTGPMEVTLTAVNPMTAEEIKRVFWAPTSGGYIREGSRHIADDRQVCIGLLSRGSTLCAHNAADLLANDPSGMGDLS